MRTLQSTTDLKMAIRGICVKDYGDFRRKSVSYLNRYIENQSRFHKGRKKYVESIKHHIQYKPNLDLRKTQLWLLKQVDQMPQN